MNGSAPPDFTALVRITAPEDLPALAGRLREAEVLLQLRLRQEPEPAPLTGTALDSADNGVLLLTYKDAARRFSCSESYIETLALQGKIPTVRLPASDKAGRPREGRLVRILAADLSAWIERNRT